MEISFLKLLWLISSVFLRQLMSTLPVKHTKHTLSKFKFNYEKVKCFLGSGLLPYSQVVFELDAGQACFFAYEIVSTVLTGEFLMGFSVGLGLQNALPKTRQAREKQTVVAKIIW